MISLVTRRATSSSKDLRNGCSAPFEAPISLFASAAMNSWPCCRNAARMKCAMFSAAWKDWSWNIRVKKSAAISQADSRTTNRASPRQSFSSAPTTRYTRTSVPENVSPARRFRPQFRSLYLDQEHRQCGIGIPFVISFLRITTGCSSQEHNSKNILAPLRGYSYATPGCQDCYYAEREAQGKYW